MASSGFFARPPEKVVHSWDTIEYELSDGRIHRGIVVDVIEKRMRKELLIDQLMSQNSSSQILIPLHKALRFEAPTYLISRYPKRTDIVQILLQTSPNVPWTWFPGKLILTDRQSFALVQVQGSEPHLREIIVPAAHVRFDHAGKLSKRIRRSDFVKKVVQVPDRFMLDDDVRKRWVERFPGTKPCSLSSSSLSYLQAVPKSKDKKLTKITAAIVCELMDEIRMTREKLVLHSTRAYDGPCIHNILPKQIMAKIFTLLYTEQQAKARCVCKQWNVWLQSPTFSKEIRFDLCGENRYLIENDCLRKFLAYVYGNLALTCRKIVLLAGNGNVVRNVLQGERSFSSCLFDQFIKLIDPEFTCSNTLPQWDTNYPKWSTTYTLTRGGIQRSFELAVIRIYSYHGPNEDALEPTVFPQEFRLKSGLPTALKPSTMLSEVRSVSAVCMSNPTRCVFTMGDLCGRDVLTWDIFHKRQLDNPVHPFRTQCFEQDHLAQLKISADGNVLFAGGRKEIAVLDVCNGVPRVKTVLRDPGVPLHHCSYYAEGCPMAVSPDGNLCFASCIMAYIIAWDVRIGKVIARFQEPPKTEASECIDRSSDGLTLWTGGQDMKLRCLDVRTLTQQSERDITGLCIYSVRCCPDNEWIAVGTTQKFSYVDTYEEWVPGTEYIRQSSVVVDLLNTSKPEQYRLATLDEDEPRLLRYSPNGDWLLATTNMELNLFHHPYGRLAYKEYMAGALNNYYYGGCDISPHGRFVAQGLLGDIRVYEVIY